jgi:hypothetical protein
MFHIMHITEVEGRRGHLRLDISRVSLLKSYHHIRFGPVITPNGVQATQSSNQNPGYHNLDGDPCYTNSVYNKPLSH